MRRDYTHRDIAFTVTVTAAPGMRFRWSFETANGLIGNGGPIGGGMEWTFREGRHAAEDAINAALG